MAIRRVRLPDGTVYEIHGDGFTDAHADDIVRQLSQPIPPPPEPPPPSRIPGAAIDWIKGGISHYFTEPNIDESGQLRVGRPEELRRDVAESLSAPILPELPGATVPTDIPQLMPRMFGPSKNEIGLYNLVRGQSSPLNLAMLGATPVLWPEGVMGKALGTGLGIQMAGQGIRQMREGEMAPGAVNVALAALPFVGGFKGKTVPPFYSQLERVIEAKMPRITTVEQLGREVTKPTGEKSWAGILGDPTVKPAEIEATGLGNWLRTLVGSGQKITKDEVMTRLAEGKVEVKDVDYGGSPHQAEVDRLNLEYEHLDQQRIHLPENDPARLDLLDRQLAIQRQVRELEREGRAYLPKFNRATLQLPGGTGYREKLLVIPGGKERTEYHVQALGLRRVFPSEGSARNFISQNFPPEANVKIEPVTVQEPTYTEPHWDVTNAFASMNLTDRLTSTGEPMLFAEELQSEWTRQARKAREEGSPFATHPFEKNWHEIALWKLLRTAAEEGKERVGWPQGAVIKDRYNLAKYFSKVSTTRLYWGVDPRTFEETDPTGLYRVEAWDKEGNRFMDRNVPESDLAETIGADLAEKAKAAGPGAQKWTGLNLAIGGEWADKLYDQMLVQAANRIGKRYGARVEDTRIPIEVTVPEARRMGVEVTTKRALMADKTIHSIQITPELRDALLGEGRALFQLPWIVGAAGAGLAGGAAASKVEAADYEYDRKTGKIRRVK
jgi:hypothetical protein